jgi:Uma2 family endonuclease
MTGFSEEPRATYSAHMDKAAFFAWLRTREGGRYELKNGEIIVHAGSTIRHARLSAKFVVALANRLDADAWAVATSDAAIQIGEDIRYPDVVVERLVNDGSTPSTKTPTLLIEVLSPSSVGRDMREKLAEYVSLPSLEAYIVASQDEPIVWIWQRDASTRGFAAEPTEIAGREREITLDALGISLPLAEIYRGLGAA